MDRYRAHTGAIFNFLSINWIWVKCQFSAIFRNFCSISRNFPLTFAKFFRNFCLILPQFSLNFAAIFFNFPQFPTIFVQFSLNFPAILKSIRFYARKFKYFTFLKSFNFSAKIQIGTLASFRQYLIFWTKIAILP